jgi:GrpB-like predicted nucleotidyltransferase (UPF0157 family)
MIPILEPAAKPKAEFHEWEECYVEVVKSLMSAMPPLPEYLAIEHVGSTAVPGCGGKGVIDLLGRYRAGHLDSVKAFLLELGFGRQGPEFARAWPETRPMYLAPSGGGRGRF